MKIIVGGMYVGRMCRFYTPMSYPSLAVNILYILVLSSKLSINFVE